jgi:hypothetical protein
MSITDAVAIHRALLERATKPEEHTDGLCSELSSTVNSVLPAWNPELPSQWPTLLDAPEGPHKALWWNMARWAACELIRMADGGGPRPPRMGGDRWKEYAGDEWFVDAQWKELKKAIMLIANPPKLVAPEKVENLVTDPMTADSGLWEYPEGLDVHRDAVEGTRWCGKTDKLAWNPEPTSGTWLWLKQELPSRFVLSQNYYTVGELTANGLLIQAICAKRLPETQSWDHASGPNMGFYYDFFDSYHFSASRGDTGYCNLRRCGPGLIMLSSIVDPARESGVWRQTQILKHEGIIDFYVDGRLSCSYLDLGLITPRLDTGRFGFRHVQHYTACHKNFVVDRLA